MRLSDALAGLDFERGIDEGELVADAVVLVRCVQAETGAESAYIVRSRNIGGLVTSGLISMGWHIDGAGWHTVEDK